MRRFWCFLSAAFLAFFLIAGMAINASSAEKNGTAGVPGVKVSAPKMVLKGQPFFVRVESSGPLRAVLVQWAGKEVRPSVMPDGDGYAATALLGVGLGAKEKARTLDIQVETAQGKEQFQRSIAIRDKDYPEQWLKVARKYTELTKEQLQRHRGEQALSKATLKMISPVRFWGCPFNKPVPGGISSEFGLRRFFNGEPRNPHTGLDLRGKEGDPIRAAASGEVVLAGEHYFAGKSVYIDHGQGVVTMYFHMSRVLVEPGDAVASGDVIGLVGATGRVTGPHLHFGVSVLGDSVAPGPLLDQSCGQVKE